MILQDVLNLISKKCRCSKIRLVQVEDVVPDAAQQNTIQVLTNGEIWFVACDGQTVILGVTEGVLTCADVLTCIGVDTVGGNPTLFLNETGGFTAPPASPDTNSFNDDLTQDANRAHTSAGFTTIIDNSGGYTVRTPVAADRVTEQVAPTGYTITAVDGTNSAVVSVEPEQIEISSSAGTDSSEVDIQPTAASMSSTDGGNTSSVTTRPSAIVLNSDGDIYIGDEAGGNLPDQETATWDLGLDANGKVVIQSAVNESVEHFGINIDEGGVVSTGYKGRLIVPYAGTITGWTILETSEVPITGDIVVDVLLGTYANYDTTPTFASIAGTEKPTISADVKGQDLTLTTWTTAVAAGDILQFSVDSAATVEKVYVSVIIQRT